MKMTKIINAGTPNDLILKNIVYNLAQHCCKVSL